MRNELLRARREATPSSAPSRAGKPMSQSELARAVNRVVSAQTGRPGKLTVHVLKRYERGAIRWPSKRYRDAIRVVLHAASDEELGFFPIPRGLSRRVAPREDGSREPIEAVESSGTDQAPALWLAEGHAAGQKFFARALIRNGKQLLLVRTSGIGGGLFPGGPVRPTMSIYSALLNYVAEQTGVSARIVGFAGVVVEADPQDDGRDMITLVFDGAPTSTPRSADYGADAAGPLWLPAEALAHHDLQPTAVKEALIEGADGPFWRLGTP